MKEHPILFKGEMVTAILEGRKTQTRRLIKPQPFSTADGSWHIELNPRVGFNSQRTLRNMLPYHCPHGQPGDRLWVKETWAIICNAALPLCSCETDEERKVNHYVEYRADTGNPYPGEWPEDEAKGNDEAPKWKSSMFMPRWASRITLEIVNVRVERLQDIDNHESWKEGIQEFGKWIENEGVARDEYARLWNRINGAGSWEENPWVWVVEFKRVEK